MRANVPGIHIPITVIERLEKTSDSGTAGKHLCTELIRQVCEIEGVQGVHVMGWCREHPEGEIIEESGKMRERALQAK